MIELNERQKANYEKLKSYYPYRMFFLVEEKGKEADVWAMRDMRAINKAIQDGAKVFRIEQ